MTATPLPAIANRTELLELLTSAARKGSVLAMRLLLAELRMDATGAKTPSVIDELAQRRRAGTIR